MVKVRIGELCDYHKGASIPRSETDIGYDIPYLHYGDIYKKYDFRINLDEKIKSIIKIKKTSKIKPEQYLHDGDIVYTLTSETIEDLGHSTLVINKSNFKFVSGMETTIIRIKDKNCVFPPYLNYLFQSNEFRKKLRQFVTGMKVYRVHPSDLMNILIELPNYETQQKIAHILDNISDKIDIDYKINDYLVA